MRILIIIVIFLASCSEDPEPQKPCAQLEQELNTAQKAVLELQAKGSNGNQDVWLNKLNNLIRTRDGIQAEYTTRHCL
jgi:hypothetical protein